MLTAAQPRAAWNGTVATQGTILRVWAKGTIILGSREEEGMDEAAGERTATRQGKAAVGQFHSRKDAHCPRGVPGS